MDDIWCKHRKGLLPEKIEMHFDHHCLLREAICIVSFSYQSILKQNNSPKYNGESFDKHVRSHNKVQFLFTMYLY